MEFGTISVSDGISMGHEGMHFSLVSREVIADSRRDGHAGRAPRRLGAAGRLRQVAARHADGRGPARPGQRVPLRRLDPARLCQAVGRHGDGSHDHRRVRGRRRLRARADAARGRRRDRARDLPRRGRLRRHVHRQHHGLSGRGAGHVAARLSAAPPATDRRRDGFARRSGEAVVEPAAPRHHRPRHPDQGGVRERDRRGDGIRRLDQRGAAPAGHRARGRSEADAGRLQPHRRQGAAPGRRQAVRPAT